MSLHRPVKSPHFACILAIRSNIQYHLATLDNLDFRCQRVARGRHAKTEPNRPPLLPHHRGAVRHLRRESAGYLPAAGNRSEPDELIPIYNSSGDCEVSPKRGTAESPPRALAMMSGGCPEHGPSSGRSEITSGRIRWAAITPNKCVPGWAATNPLDHSKSRPGKRRLRTG
jgi:hypothetical protein